MAQDSRPTEERLQVPPEPSGAEPVPAVQDPLDAAQAVAPTVHAPEGQSAPAPYGYAAEQQPAAPYPAPAAYAAPPPPAGPPPIPPAPPVAPLPDTSLPAETRREKGSGRGRQIGGIILIALGVLFLAQYYLPGFDMAVVAAVVLILIGVLLIARGRKS